MSFPEAAACNRECVDGECRDVETSARLLYEIDLETPTYPGAPLPTDLKVRAICAYNSCRAFREVVDLADDLQGLELPTFLLQPSDLIET